MKDIVYENGEQIWRPLGRGMVNNQFVFDWLRANRPNTPALREHVQKPTWSEDAAALRKLAGV